MGVTSRRGVSAHQDLSFEHRVLGHNICIRKINISDQARRCALTGQLEATTTGDRELPAVERALADVRPSFLFKPHGSHLIGSREALTDLCSLLTSDDMPTAKHLDVRIFHVVSAFVSPLLYWFSIERIGEDELFEEASEDHQTIDIAVVANHPVEVQIETVLGFTGQLLARQRTIADLMGSGGTASDMPYYAAAADSQGRKDVVDELRMGWRSAAHQLRLQAARQGFKLSYRYDSPHVSDAGHLAKRSSLLRATYNQLDDFRTCIDGVVAAITGRESRVSGGLERWRRYLQQQHVVTSPARYFAQAVRDALVLGNGYIAFAEVEPLGVYALFPDSLQPLDGEKVQSRATGQEWSNVIHFTGFEQPGTPLGFGLGELMLPYLKQKLTIERGIEAMQPWISGLPQDQRIQVEGWHRLRDELDQGRRTRVAQLFPASVYKRWIPRKGLYFEGSELM